MAEVRHKVFMCLSSFHACTISGNEHIIDVRLLGLLYDVVSDNVEPGGFWNNMVSDITSYFLGRSRYEECMSGVDFNQRPGLLVYILQLCGGLGNATTWIIDQLWFRDRDFLL